MIYDVIVIGGGPAGLMAAIKASENGAKVLLLEKMEKVARKLRITGKGRCNITNLRIGEEFLKHIHPQNKFFRPAFKNFSNTDLVAYLNKIGLPTAEERGDRVFPASQKAWDVADALHNRALELGIEIQCHTTVNDWLFDAQQQLHAVQCTHQNTSISFQSKTFIIATGGLSYPRTGCTGDGYLLAQQVKHQIVPTRPVLNALEVHDYQTDLNQLSLKNVELSLWIDGGCVQKEFGEMEFTPFGIAGPIVVRVSRKAVDALIAGKRVLAQLDLKPALDQNQLEKRIDRETELSVKSTVKQLLETLLPKQIIPFFAEIAKLDLTKTLHKLNGHDRKQITTYLKNTPLAIADFRPFSEAIVTAGGISLTEISSKTLQSKYHHNLFFAGEVIDLDGDTGGYNLQIAFSTGYLAGLQAAKLALGMTK